MTDLTFLLMGKPYPIPGIYTKVKHNAAYDKMREALEASKAETKRLVIEAIKAKNYSSGEIARYAGVTINWARVIANELTDEKVLKRERGCGRRVYWTLRN